MVIRLHPAGSPAAGRRRDQDRDCYLLTQTHTHKYIRIKDECWARHAPSSTHAKCLRAHWLRSSRGTDESIETNRSNDWLIPCYPRPPSSASSCPSSTPHLSSACSLGGLVWVQCLKCKCIQIGSRLNCHGSSSTPARSENGFVLSVAATQELSLSEVTKTFKNKWTQVWWRTKITCRFRLTHRFFFFSEDKDHNTDNEKGGIIWIIWIIWT